MEKQSKLSTFVNIMIDILFVPVVILALFSSVLMFNAKKHNQMPSLFGYSSVVILSSSMEPSFKPGDNVLAKAVDTDTLKVGDVIAFYAYYKEKITPANLEQNSQPATSTTGGNIPTTLLSFLGGGASNYDQEEAASHASKVLFHQIVKIYEVVEDDGISHRYFVTQGTNASTPDTYAIKDTMVVGKYIDAPLVANVFRFAGSPVGIAVLVVIPCGLMLLLMSRSIIDQVAKHKEEQRKNEEQTKQAAMYYNESEESVKQTRNVDIRIPQQNVGGNRTTQKSRAPKAPVAPTPKAQPTQPAQPKAPTQPKVATQKAQPTQPVQPKAPTPPKPQQPKAPTPPKAPVPPKKQ